MLYLKFFETYKEAKSVQRNLGTGAIYSTKHNFDIYYALTAIAYYSGVRINEKELPYAVFAFLK